MEQHTGLYRLGGNYCVRKNVSYPVQGRHRRDGDDGGAEISGGADAAGGSGAGGGGGLHIRIKNRGRHGNVIKLRYFKG